MQLHQKKIVKVAALLIPATLTAVVAGITEPLEFTFLLRHFIRITCTTSSNYGYTDVWICVVGNMGGGVLDFIATNWIPLGKAHWMTYVFQVVIGLIFVAIYYFLFKYLILKFDIPLPGRKKGEEVKLFSKQDYNDKKEIQSQSFT